MFRLTAIFPGWLFRARFTFSLAEYGHSGRGRDTAVFDSDMIPSVCFLEVIEVAGPRALPVNQIADRGRNLRVEVAMNFR